MSFSPGDRVHIERLGTGVVREVRRGGRIVVEVKGRVFLVEGAQLTRAEPGKRSAKQRGAPAAASNVAPHARADAPSTLDLHGMTSIEAVAAVDEFVNDAILAGLTALRIIHGRSGGRVKAAVHARLRELAPVRHFRVDPSNPGVTIAEL